MAANDYQPWMSEIPKKKQSETSQNNGPNNINNPSGHRPNSLCVSIPYVHGTSEIL